MYICRVSQITPRARENFIASRRTWNFPHHFKILLYHCTHRLIRETKGKLGKCSYSFKKTKTKKNKENKSKELLSKLSFTNNDNNRIFIQHWLHNYIYKKITYKLMLIESCFLTAISLILKWLISIFNEVIENVKGGLVSSCKIAN